MFKYVWFKLSDRFYSLFKREFCCDFCGEQLRRQTNYTFNTKYRVGPFSYPIGDIIYCLQYYYCPNYPQHCLYVYNTQVGRLICSEYHTDKYLIYNRYSESHMDIYHAKPIPDKHEEITIPKFYVERLSLEKINNKISTYILFS